jgi:predicted anti-sigma-YlaC factor YlaD
VTCQEALALLGEYLEATLGASAGEGIEAHLQDCDECLAYLNTYRRTTELTRAVARVEMPAQMRKRLHNFLILRLGEL